MSHIPPFLITSHLPTLALRLAFTHCTLGVMWAFASTLHPTLWPHSLHIVGGELPSTYTPSLHLPPWPHPQQGQLLGMNSNLYHIPVPLTLSTASAVGRHELQPLPYTHPFDLTRSKCSRQDTCREHFLRDPRSSRTIPFWPKQNPTRFPPSQPRPILEGKKTLSHGVLMKKLLIVGSLPFSLKELKSLAMRNWIRVYRM